MNNGLENYKNFIDGLVKHKDGVEAIWVLKSGYPNTKENERINMFLKSLSQEQKNIAADLVQDARISGIHDTLAYMDELVDLDGFELRKNGEKLITDQFESMHFDFICRCEGDDWPK